MHHTTLRGLRFCTRGRWVYPEGVNNLDLAVESPWSALDGPFLSCSAHTGLENGLLGM